MSKNPYDYTTRKGIHSISWEDFHGICKALAKAVFRFQPKIILATGSGGYYPGTLIAPWYAKIWITSNYSRENS